MVNATVPSAWRARRIDAAGATLAAYETGSDASGAPVVLLLHGLGHWTDGAWGRLVPHLDPALRCVAFDLPGFGASDKPAVRYDRAFFRRAMDDAVDALELKRFALAGHSLGGFIAADWAGAHPERVSHLALIAPAAFARTGRHLVYALASSVAGRLFTRRRPSASSRASLRRSVADPSALDPAHVERAYELAQELALRKAFAGVYAGALRSPSRTRANCRPASRATPGPVMCAWGKHDRYIPPAALREVVRVYPHAKTLILENSGHLPMIEEPAKLGTALHAFFAK